VSRAGFEPVITVFGATRQYVPDSAITALLRLYPSFLFVVVIDPGEGNELRHRNVRILHEKGVRPEVTQICMLYIILISELKIF
jgi:hypothetical protein